MSNDTVTPNPDATKNLEERAETEALEAGTPTPSLEADTTNTEALEAGAPTPSLEAHASTSTSTSTTPEEIKDYQPLVGPDAPHTPEVQQAEQFGQELVSTQNIIHRYSRELDELNEKMKHMSESMKNLMDNDNELQELEAQAKTVTQDVKNRKQRVKESPEAVQLQMKTKELKEEKKELQESLSNHLLRYYQMTGSQVIEEADGTEREMRINAKLKGKKRSE